jgi:hypothetical protein
VPLPDHGTDGNDERRSGGISLQTLIVASAASASASFAIARLWGPGTLIGAAAAPVIVALVSEALRRPLQSATATARRLPTARAAAVHPAANPWLHRWRLALVTGLLAFAIILGVYTVPDLLAGHSITGNGQPTTFFGGTTKAATKPDAVTGVTRTITGTVTKTVPATAKARPGASSATTTSTPTATSSTTSAPTTPTTETTTASVPATTTAISGTSAATTSSPASTTGPAP